MIQRVFTGKFVESDVRFFARNLKNVMKGLIKKTYIPLVLSEDKNKDYFSLTLSKDENGSLELSIDKVNDSQQVPCVLFS